MSQDLDVHRDPRFDAIIARMQANSEMMTPTEVLANALADAYIIGTEDGKQERDELRAQVATLTKSDVEKLPKVNPAAQDLIGTTITEIDGTGWLAAETPIGRIGNYANLTALFMAMVWEYQKREERAAQYVRGLEAALQEIDNQLANQLIGHDTLRIIIKRAIRVALAAKEDRG